MSGSETYSKAAKAISDYRKKAGVITDISFYKHKFVSAELLDKRSPYFNKAISRVISADVVGAVVGKDLRTERFT